MIEGIFPIPLRPLYDDGIVSRLNDQLPLLRVNTGKIFCRFLRGYEGVKLFADAFTSYGFGFCNGLLNHFDGRFTATLFNVIKGELVVIAKELKAVIPQKRFPSFLVKVSDLG